MPGPIALPDSFEVEGQPVIRAYVETHKGIRFLLPILPSRPLDTHIDADDDPNAAERADVVITTTKTSDVGIRLELSPAGRGPAGNIDLTVFLSPSVNVFPRTGDDPAEIDWTYVRFLGRNDEPDLSQPVPEPLWIQLDVVPDKNGRATTTVELGAVGGVGPLRVQVGQVRAPRVEREARVATGSGAAYDDSQRETIRAAALPWDEASVPAFPAPYWQHIDLRVGVVRQVVSLKQPITLTMTAPDTGPVRSPAPPGVRLAAGAGVTPGKHSYRVAYVLANGAETAPSKASAQLTTTSAEGQVSLTLPVPAEQAAGAYEVTGRRVYRTVAGDAGEAFLAGEIADASTTTWVDTVDDAALGEVPPSTLVARLDMPEPLAVEAYVRDRTTAPLPPAPAVDRRINAVLTGLPTSVGVAYDARAASPTPRLRWTADGRVDGAEVTVTGMEGDYAVAAARLASVPTRFGLEWRLRDPSRLRIELCGEETGTPASGGVGAVRFALAQSAADVLGWRSPGVVADVDTREGGHIRAGATQVTRLAVDVGQPNGRYMVDGAGFAVAVAHGTATEPPGPATRPPAERSGQVAFVDGSNRVVARAVALPDDFGIDARLGHGYAGVWASGRVDGFLLHHQDTPAAVGAPTTARVWLALPATPDAIDVLLDGGVLTIANSGPAEGDIALGLDAAGASQVRARLRLPASARLLLPGDHSGEILKADEKTIVPAAPLSDLLVGDPLVATSGANAGRMAAITAIADGEVTTEPFPVPLAAGDTFVVRGGLRLAAAAPATGRVSVVMAPPDQQPAPPTVRSNPQVLVTPAGIAARVLGATALRWGGNVVERSLTFELDAGRLNPSARIRMVDKDGRDSLVLRAARLPASVTAVLTSAGAVTGYELTMSEPPGPVYLYAQPAQPHTAPGSPPEPAGVGLVRADLIALPAHVRLSLDAASLGPDVWASTPAHWATSAAVLEADGRADVRWLRMITRSRDELVDPHRVRWGRTDVAGLLVESAAPDAEPSLVLWTISEHLTATNYEGHDAGLAFRIHPEVKVWVDMDSYTAETTDQTARWPAFNTQWRLRAELQMRAFQGRALVGPPAYTDQGWGLADYEERGLAGDWFLRILDAIAPGGSAYFGSMGWGIPINRATRQRIYD